jgi:hypothetical protein
MTANLVKRLEVGLLNRVLIPATSTYSTSLLVVTVVALLREIAHFAGSPDIGNHDYGLRAILVVISMVPVFGLIGGTHFFRSANLWLVAGIRIAGYLLGGALGGLTLYFLLRTFYPISHDSIPLRVFGGLVTVTGTVFLLTLAITYYQNHKVYVAGLQQETLGLEDALRKLEVENKQRSDIEWGQFLKQVSGEIAAMHFQPPPAQIAALEALLDQKVRPKSREYSTQVSSWKPQPSIAEPPKFMETWAQQNLFGHLPVWWNGFIIGVEALPSATYYFGWQQGLAAIGSGSLAIAIVFFLQRKYLARLFESLKSPFREIVLTILFVVAGLIGGWATQQMLVGTKNPGLYMGNTAVITTFYGWAATLATTYLQDTKLRGQKLEEVRDRLRWTIARVGMVMWSTTGVMSRLLHGPVQNALHATLIRMRDQNPQTVIDEMLNELQSRLDAAGGSGIDLVDGSSKEFVAQLNEVCDIWSGLAHFEFELDPQVLRNLVNDDIANGILLDLCRETVSNPIRHGSAKTFHISLSAGEQSVQLEIIDDGLFNPGPNPGPPGIGTQMLNACTIDRSQTHNAGSNVLRALLPCLT